MLLDEGALARVLITTGVGESDIYPTGSTWPTTRSIFEELRRTRRTIHRDDFSDDPGPDEQQLLDHGLRARVVAPLDSGEELLGALAISRCDPRSFRPYEIALLSFDPRTSPSDRQPR